MAEEEIVDKEEKKDEEERDIYDKEDDEKLVEEDEITPAEAGFMEGYEGDGKSMCTCDNCGKAIDPTDAIEKEALGKDRTFCCEDCAEKFSEREEPEEKEE